MNKTELVAEVADRLETSLRDADIVVKEVFDVIVQAVAAGEKVSIPGVGNFEAVERAAREARNPQTGDLVKVAATTVPKFKAGQGFKDAVATASKKGKSKAKATKA